MVFQKKARKFSKSAFSINSKELKSITEFTYLGITINAGCSFLPTLKDQKDKTPRAIFALN